MSIFEPNNAGTVRFTNGSTAIVGVGTLFTSYKAGSVISIPGVGEMQLAADPTSDTAAAGQVAWQGATIAAPGLAFQYIPRNEQATFSQKLTALLNQFANGNLQALVGISIAANKLIKGVGAGVLGVQDFTAWAQSMLALPGVANRLPYLDAANTAALTPLTAYARSILDDADAATARATLGLSNVAFTNTPNNFSGLQTIAGDINQTSGHTALTLASIPASPSFWTTVGTLWHQYGYLGTNGSFAFGLYYNGYRNSVGSWTSLGVNGSSAGGSIELRAAGIYFAAESSVAGNTPVTRLIMNTDGRLFPVATASYDLGGSSNRFNNIYLSNNPNVSSDERLKDVRGALTEEEVRAGLAIGREIVAYQRKHVVEVEGADARLHVGVSAQQVATILEAEGLDPARYAFWCADALTLREEYTEQRTRTEIQLVEGEDGEMVPEPIEVIEDVTLDRFVPVLDEDGEQIVQLSIRYEQLAMFVAAAQAAHQGELERRIAALEAS